MKPISDCNGNVVGWKYGEVLCNRRGTPCGFVRGTEVMTFGQRHIGKCERNLFCDSRGQVVGFVGATGTPLSSPRQRRKRCSIGPWLRVSFPAPRRMMSFRVWAIWDHALDMIATEQNNSGIHECAR